MLGVPKLPDNAVEFINRAGLDESNEIPGSKPVLVDLSKLEDAVTAATTPQEVAAYAPIPERAPELVADSIRKSHDQTACQVELVADQMLEEAKEAHKRAYATAKAIRDYGETEAASAAKSLGLVRDNYRVFREQQDRLTQFISGAAQ